MRLLLDTHTFLWWCADDPSLSQLAREHIAESNNEVYLSAVSAWEIAIKARLGKLPLPDKPDKFVAAMLKRHGFGVLTISMKHVLADHDLPTHHSDPFDRLLIAQAIIEDLSLISNDAKLANYPVTVLW